MFSSISGLCSLEASRKSCPPLASSPGRIIQVENHHCSGIITCSFPKVVYSFIFKKELLVGFVVLFLFVFVWGKYQAVFLSARGGGRRGGTTLYNWFSSLIFGFLFTPSFLSFQATYLSWELWLLSLPHSSFREFQAVASLLCFLHLSAHFHPLNGFQKPTEISQPLIVFLPILYAVIGLSHFKGILRYKDEKQMLIIIRTSFGTLSIVVK